MPRAAPGAGTAIRAANSPAKGREHTLWAHGGSEAHSSLFLCVFRLQPLKHQEPPALQTQARPGLVPALELAPLLETKDTLLRGLFCVGPRVLTPGPPGSGARPFLAAFSFAVSTTPFRPPHRPLQPCFQC